MAQGGGGPHGSRKKEPSTSHLDAEVRKPAILCRCSLESAGVPMTSSGSGKGSWGAPTLIGIPLDENSSYKRGAAAAPQLIRDALKSESSNMWTELGVDVGAEGAYEDAGDLTL